MIWRIYLAGEIHSNWREQIAQGVTDADLPVILTSPITDHAASDDCGTTILGDEDQNVWKDHKGAMLNAIRTRTLIDRADVVVVKFGDKYRQWNAAFDAGYAFAKNKRIITLHDPALGHALKEVNAAALAVTQNPKQVIEVIKYITQDTSDK